MIRDIDTDQFKINVKLKTGHSFEGMDMPPNPTGQYDRIVSFWYNGKMRCYPLGEVEFFEFVPDKEER